ncbi:MAG: prepilin peptidase [bacterium]|nr:prepilin peptidase [bacterium]
MLDLFIFFLGATIGSFLTVVVDRLPRNISITRGRSLCDSCKHSLSWYDLFPVVSYLLLRGKCRYCGVPIGPHHLLMEILVGVLFLVVYYTTLASSISLLDGGYFLIETLIYRFLVVCALFVIFFIDLKHRMIPLSALLILGVLGVFNLAMNPVYAVQAVAVAVGSFLFFFLIHALTHGRGMGFGDVLFVFVMGLLLGFPTTIVAVYLAFLTGAVVSLILLLGGRKKLKSSIAFGPFLVGGTFLCLLWGQQLTQAFLTLLRIV